jgi:uncharacterized protein YbbK (DUF523 family)
MKLDATAVVLGRWQSWHSKDVPLRLGVSACLLGENVRYDGGHARDRFVADALGQWFEFVPVCPEMEIGMGTPRPTVRLVEEGRRIRLVAPSTGGTSLSVCWTTPRTRSPSLCASTSMATF